MRSGRRTSTVGSQRGQILPLFALMALTIVGFVGLVVDTGSGQDDQRRAQSAADAAALRAAYSITKLAVSTAINGTEVTDARNLTVANGYPSATLAIVELNATGGTPSNVGAVATVKATITDANRKTFVMGVLGQNTITVSATGTASITATCGLCALGAGTTMQWNESLGLVGLLDTVNVTGIIETNGNMTTGGTGLTTSLSSNSGNGPILVSGTYTNSLVWSVSPAPTTGAAPFTDPLSRYDFATDATVIAAKSPIQNSGILNVTSSQTIAPGYYRGINVSNSAVLTFQSNGTFYIGDGGIVGGAPSSSCILSVCTNGPNNQINGSGVTLALGCSTVTGLPTACASGGALGGGMNIGSTTSLSLTGPSSGSLSNMLIFGDAHNTASILMPAVNLTASPLQGAIYLPSGTMDITDAGAGLTNTSIKSMIVVNSFKLTMALLGSTVTIDTSYHPTLQAGISLSQ